MIEREKYTATNEIVCPYCGHGHDYSTESTPDRVECHLCDCVFAVEDEVVRTFTSRPMGTCLTCGKLVEIRWRHAVGNQPAHWRCAPHPSADGTCQCSGSKKGFTPQEGV